MTLAQVTARELQKQNLKEAGERLARFSGHLFMERGYAVFKYMNQPYVKDQPDNIADFYIKNMEVFGAVKSSIEPGTDMMVQGRVNVVIVKMTFQDRHTPISLKQCGVEFAALAVHKQPYDANRDMRKQPAASLRRG